MKITNQYTGGTIFEAESASIKGLLALAIKALANLSGADLSAANLRGADLREANLSAADLREADLSAANLSGANLSAADLSAADLREANLSGADLSGADLSAANLSWANLSAANLREANLSGANLSAADLSAADLREANLSGADLSGADLSAANLSGADLSGADLSAADLPEIPKVENLDARILEAIKQGGELNMESWHKCETTHCRAGWAIVLAGEPGKALENRIGSCASGALIYHASTGRVPNFFATDKEALEDIKACAAKEVEK